MISSTLSDPGPRPRAEAVTDCPSPAVAVVPDLGAIKEGCIRAFAVLTLLYGTYFIAWRWTSTLNLHALWMSVPLAVAETMVLLTTFLLVFTVWRLHRREAPPAPEGRSVDVFITTYDEPLDIIRKTALGARAIRYPHRTWILDDGRRFEVRALARELGMGYITREGNAHAKAGNLNNALRETDGEFILQLDADHVPLPHILDRLLGYMQDERVAFVQSPQNFYNTDSFGTHFRADTRRLLSDQSIFFSVIQPGKDRHNAAFFCGSCGVLRRRAIMEIGGFSTETVTEDIETSLVLHGRGWTSVYHAEPLAYGLAPRTATAFHIQRLRWARGGMQLLRRFNPLTYPGLTFSQRLSYLASVLHPLDGLVRFIFLITPLLFLVTGVFPIRTFNAEFFLHFVPFILALLLLHALLARGTAGPLWYAEFGSMSRFFTHTVALFAYFTRKRLAFRVTPKGLNVVAWPSYAPHVALVAITAVAVVWGILAYRSGWIEYGRTDSAELPFLVNVLWAGWNCAIGLLVLRTSIRSHQRRPDHRFDELMPAHYSVTRNGVAHRRVGLVENLNARGLAFRSIRPVEPGDPVTFTLPLTTGDVTVRGRVVHRRAGLAGRIAFHHHGVALEDVSRATADAIEMHCTHHAVPATRARYVERTDPFSEAARMVRDPRKAPRVAMGLPVLVGTATPGQPWTPEHATLGVLEESSRTGLRFLLDTPVPAGAELRFHVPDTAIHGRVTVAHCSEVCTPFGAHYIAGAARGAGAGFHPLVEQRREGPMRKVAVLAGLLTAARKFTFVALIACLSGTVPFAAEAQLSQGYLTGAERDSDGQSLLLLGGWISQPRQGWSPVLGVIAYRLAYADHGSDAPVAWTANPFLGLRHQWTNGGLQLNAGYSFQRLEGADELPDVGRQRVSSGLTMSLQGDYGAGAPRGAQALVNYSWDDGGYLWSRVRAGQKVFGGPSRFVRLGAEASAQGNDDYRAYELGPLFEWFAAPGLAIVGSAGWRRGVVTGATDNNVGYGRLELVLVR